MYALAVSSVPHGLPGCKIGEHDQGCATATNRELVSALLSNDTRRLLTVEHVESSLSITEFQHNRVGVYRHQVINLANVVTFILHPV